VPTPDQGRLRLSSSRPTRRLLAGLFGVVAGVATAAMIFAPLALAYHQITYWTPTPPNVPGNVGNTFDGYVDREYNKAFHLSGKTYTVWYQDSSHNIFCNKTDTANPTQCLGHFNAKAAFTENNNDSSSTQETSQTTNPSP
jgi:hypothetical protein